MLRRLLPLASVAALLFAVACAPEDLDPEATPEPTPEDTPVAMATCTNPEDGFTVSYPQDWHTNTGDVMPECTVFHPEEFTIPPDTEIPTDLAIVIQVEPVPFEAVAETDERFERELDRHASEIQGREAVALEVEATGEGLYPEGHVSYRWAVDLDGETLVGETHDVEELDYDFKKGVLDEMMRTIELPA